MQESAKIRCILVISGSRISHVDCGSFHPVFNFNIIMKRCSSVRGNNSFVKLTPDSWTCLIVSLLRGSNDREAFLTDRWICKIVSLLRGSNDCEAFLTDRWICLIVSLLRGSNDRDAFLSDRWICKIVSLLRESNDSEAFLADRWKLFNCSPPEGELRSYMKRSHLYLYLERLPISVRLGYPIDT